MALAVIMILYVVIWVISAAGLVAIVHKYFSAKAEQIFFALDPATSEFAFTSEYEGYGHALHEALSVGAALATTDAAPMNEPEVNRRRLTFEVEVTGPQGVVSRGTHQRAVVSLDRMG